MTVINLVLNNQDDLEIILSAIRREKDLLEWEIKKIESELSKIEKKYSMTSKDFYQKYSQGNLGDDEDYMIWVGEYDFLVKFYEKKKRLKDLINECQKHIVQ